MDVLSEIIAKKRERLVTAKEVVPLAQLVCESRQHGFRNAMSRDGINVIAEFKRRSPSKGIIRPDADVVEIVKGYEAGALRRFLC